jgi:hypothetical protein
MPSFAPAKGRSPLMDMVYVVGVLVFLGATWGLVRLCEKVS